MYDANLDGGVTDVSESENNGFVEILHSFEKQNICLVFIPRQNPSYNKLIKKGWSRQRVDVLFRYSYNSKLLVGVLS